MHGTKRPIKVSKRSYMAVKQLLWRARNLKNSLKYRSVFLSFDRLLDERKLQQELVVEMKISAVEKALHTKGSDRDC